MTTKGFDKATGGSSKRSRATAPVQYCVAPNYSVRRFASELCDGI